MPECEFGLNNRELPFDQSWLNNAIPTENGKIDNCYRYAPINYNKIEPNQCSADMFNKSRKIPCNEYIYATDEKNVQTEVQPKPIYGFFVFFIRFFFAVQHSLFTKP